MNAIVYHKYGTPEVLNLENLERPIPKANEVLIKVHAVALNSWDWDLLRGKPFFVRLLGGLRKPRQKILGGDVAGLIAAVGTGVTQFKTGDAVFGDLCESGWGGFAEYVCADERALTLKPSGVTFEEAAALPQAGLMALQGLRNKRKISPGDKVLVNGAGGGVGTYAVQLAKLFGAEVTAVDRSDKLQLLQSLGADHVVNYNEHDFTRNGKQYDLILDVVANRSIFDYKRTLRSSGVYVMIGGTSSTILQFMLLRGLISMKGGKKLSILSYQPNRDLPFLKDLLQSGKIKSVIDSCHPLVKVPQALQRLGEGNATGKVVISIKE